MNRGSLLTLVNVSLAAGLVLAVSSAMAQRPGPTQPPPQRLVYTQCGLGVLNVCGTEPVQQHCTYQWAGNGDRSGTFGISFGGYVCTGGGTQSRYKDFIEEAGYGVCHVIPRPSPDATRTRTNDEFEMPDDGSGESSSSC